MFVLTDDTTGLRNSFSALKFLTALIFLIAINFTALISTSFK